MLPIDWHTLTLQLAALWVIVASALAGRQGVASWWVCGLGSIGSWGHHLVSLVLRRGERCVVAGFVFTAGIFAVLIGKFIFDDYPYSGDEWPYVLQAEILSQGHLHANSPAHPRFFDVWGMVNKGRFYAWAPPGWPLLLASGALLRVSWLVNPLIGALTLLSVYALGRLVYSASVALLAVFFMLFSPFFRLHSASYFAHPSSLLFITLFVFFCARGITRQTDHDFLWAGLCGSMSFLIRPFDQVVVFCPLGAYLVLLVLLSNVLWYAFVPFHYWAGYGPRYYYASFFALALLGARGAMAVLDRLKRCWPTGEGGGLAATALGICAALSVFWVFPVKLADAYRAIGARQALYRMVNRTQLDNAVIFIRSVNGDFLPWNLTRNPPDFSGKFLYAHDLDDLNRPLIRQYLRKKFSLYEYDETKSPLLRPITPDEAVRSGG